MSFIQNTLKRHFWRNPDLSFTRDELIGTSDFDRPDQNINMFFDVNGFNIHFCNSRVISNRTWLIHIIRKMFNSKIIFFATDDQFKNDIDIFEQEFVLSDSQDEIDHRRKQHDHSTLVQIVNCQSDVVLLEGIDLIIVDISEVNLFYLPRGKIDKINHLIPSMFERNVMFILDMEKIGATFSRSVIIFPELDDDLMIGKFRKIVKEYETGVVEMKGLINYINEITPIVKEISDDLVEKKMLLERSFRRNLPCHDDIPSEFGRIVRLGDENRQFLTDRGIVIPEGRFDIFNHSYTSQYLQQFEGISPDIVQTQRVFRPRFLAIGLIIILAIVGLIIYLFIRHRRK